MFKIYPTTVKSLLLLSFLLLMAWGSDAQSFASNQYGQYWGSTIYQGHVSDYYASVRVIGGTTADSCGPYSLYLAAGPNFIPTTGYNDYLDFYINNFNNNLDTTLTFTRLVGSNFVPRVIGPDSGFRFFMSGTAYGKPSCVSGGQTSTDFTVPQGGQFSSAPWITVTTSRVIPPTIGAITTVNRAGSGTILQPTFTWTKKSDIPDSLLTYVVYRSQNGGTTVAVDTIRGTNRVYGTQTAYEDQTLLPRGTYTYTIGVICNMTHPDLQIGAGSNVTLTNDLMDATDGTIYGQTELTWINLAAAAPNDIAVLRNGHQIAVVNRGSTSYVDYNGIPGVKYNYAVAPLDASYNMPLLYTDTGYSKPNGVIKGNIYTIYNAGVSGVTVYAYSRVDNSMILDSAVTDASGYYELDNLYYDTSATFTIKPYKGTHKFNPDSLRRTLSVNNNIISGVNFTDTTVFTIQGKITFGADPHCAAGGCPSTGVTIYSNGQPVQGTTDATGKFSFAIQTEGTYVLKPVLGTHTFYPDSISLYVNGDNLNLAFTDSTTDTLYISLAGGCHNQVAADATVDIHSTSNSAYNNLGFDLLNSSTGTLTKYVVLPAQAYNVNALTASGNGSQNINVALTNTNLPVNLTGHDSATTTYIDTTIRTHPGHNDTIQHGLGLHYIYITVDTFPYDTMHATGLIIAVPASHDTIIDTVTARIQVPHTAAFVYHGVVTASIPNFPISTTCNYNNGYILSQYSSVNVPVRITETYTYSSVTCPVDSGTIDIFDDVSDISGVNTVNFYNGEYNYAIYPRSVNIAPPYTKTLEFFVNVGNSTATIAQPIVVTGAKNFTQAFVSTTPGLPYFVLHAPPGNTSFSFLAQDNTLTTTNSFSMQIGGSDGVYEKIGIGAEEPVPLTGIILGEGTEITNTETSGESTTISTELQNTFTAHTQVATAAANGNSTVYSGHMGDVYVGASMNVTFAYGEVLHFIPGGACTPKIDTQLIINNIGLNTNYFYTEDHILNTLIPQLQGIQSSLLARYTNSQLSGTPDTLARDSAALYGTYVAAWQNQVQLNHRNTDTISLPGQNVSFSDGATYDNSTTSSSSSTQSMQFSMFLSSDEELDLVLGVANTELNQTKLGTKVNMTWNTDVSANINNTHTTTIGYHLEDDNVPGNYYSMNVNTDPVYGTPCFVNVEGASACPHWPGTQARDSVQISMNNYAIANVPINQTANFIANITNESESGETRTYAVQAVPESNPYGAIISIGGQQINNSPASFTVAPGTSLPVLLTVAAGPVASDYRGLQVSAFSPCDGGEGNTITFEARFQGSCSGVNIYSPANNWLVNAGNHDSLTVVLSGYDATDSLKYIGLQYRTPGGQWHQATNPPILKDSLTQQFYTFVFNVSSLPDGPYELQAFAYCGAQQGGESYSDILTGTIDRSSLSLFGTPTPSDGVLNVTQNISVTFNGAVDCNQAAVYTPIYSSLVDASTGQVIPDSIVCSGNTLLIYTNPPGLIDSFENKTLTCTINNVYDINGNSLQQPVVWSFLVSRSLVYWNPANLNITAQQGTAPSVVATMFNAGPADSFTIIHMPTLPNGGGQWLTTAPQANYDIAAGTTQHPSADSIRFVLSSSLNAGSYNDTVIARASGKLIYLFVHADVVKPAPNWSVNANNYQYSMNVTANYSITSLNTPLSTDTRDKIAAFVGNQCRGVGYITYDALSNRYSAFITAYSNRVVGDTFTFRMWDAVPGTEYQAVEHLPFVSDGVIGQAASPYILHPAGEFQTITFTPGWNWFSLNVSDTVMTPEDVLGSITGNNGAVVKGQNMYAQFTTAATGWTGSLSTFNTNSSYMIFLDHADTLHFLGQPVADTSVISVASGWNWVGFPSQKIATAADFLSTTNPTNGDVLKSESQFTQYNGGGWTGSLNYLYPGEGYKLKSTNAFNFVVPPSRSLPSWNSENNLFQQNMTVTADLQFNGTSVVQSHYLVGAFVNGVCIGTAQPQYITALGLYGVFITVHGDTAGQAISFKVYDTDNDIEYIPTYLPVSVTPDTTVARVESPYIINVQTTTGINALTYTDGFSLLQNVPNPFAKSTNIEYIIPSAQQVTITLYDESGRMIRALVNGTQAAGTHSVSFDQDNLQGGVYFYQMRSGDFVKTRRMLILQ